MVSSYLNVMFVISDLPIHLYYITGSLFNRPRVRGWHFRFGTWRRVYSHSKKRFIKKKKTRLTFYSLTRWLHLYKVVSPESRLIVCVIFYGSLESCFSPTAMTALVIGVFILAYIMERCYDIIKSTVNKYDAVGIM